MSNSDSVLLNCSHQVKNLQADCLVPESALVTLTLNLQA